MTEHRTFRFGLGIQGASRTELIEHVRKAEDLGYSSLSVTDHVSMPRLAPISTLAALAALDSSLRLTSTVFGNDFRHPAILASEAATIDLISNGRLELGIGTGWWEPDYTQTGIVFDPPGTRVSRLIEAVHIIKGLFSGQPFTFAGQYYSIRDLDLNPKPVQRPHPPLLIGGGGKRMLSLAAKEADIVSVNPLSKGGTMDFTTFTAEVFAQKITWVREAAGERFADLILNCHIFGLVITDDQEQATERWIKEIEKFANVPPTLSIEDALGSPYVLIGTVDQIVDKLQTIWDQYGVSFFSIPGPSVEAFSPVVARLTSE